jgi:hypothetical protein
MKTHKSNHHEPIIPANAYSIMANREAQTDHTHGQSHADRIHNRMVDGPLSWRDVDGLLLHDAVLPSSEDLICGMVDKENEPKAQERVGIRVLIAD